MIYYAHKHAHARLREAWASCASQISQSVYATTWVAAKETNDSRSSIQATGGIRERISNVNQCGDNSSNTPRQEAMKQQAKSGNKAGKEEPVDKGESRKRRWKVGGGGGGGGVESELAVKGSKNLFRRTELTILNGWEQKWWGAGGKGEKSAEVEETRRRRRRRDEGICRKRSAFFVCFFFFNRRCHLCRSKDDIVFMPPLAEPETARGRQRQSRSCDAMKN